MMATDKTSLLEDVSSDMRDLCERVLTLLGSTPVSIAYYTGEVGENRGRVKLALETLARLGLARSERTWCTVLCMPRRNRENLARGLAFLTWHPIIRLDG
jgi:hypothetical protein